MQVAHLSKGIPVEQLELPRKQLWDPVDDGKTILLRTPKGGHQLVVEMQRRLTSQERLSSLYIDGEDIRCVRNKEES